MLSLKAECLVLPPYKLGHRTKSLGIKTVYTVKDVEKEPQKTYIASDKRKVISVSEPEQMVLNFKY